MPVSAVYILDSKGKVIISRDYRGDVPHKALERFITHVLETEETELKPIFEEDGINYIYIKYNSLYGTFGNRDAVLCLQSMFLRYCSLLLHVLTGQYPLPHDT